MSLLPYDKRKEALEHVVMTVFRLLQKNDIWSALSMMQWMRNIWMSMYS